MVESHRVVFFISSATLIHIVAYGKKAAAFFAGCAFSGLFLIGLESRRSAAETESA